jgi:putative membrane protein
MLLAAGIYPRVVEAIAEVTTLRFRLRSLVVLASVLAAAAVVILSLAGPARDFVVDYRWPAYSLFIGLTFGGAPTIWRMARPVNDAFWIGAAAGVVLMAIVAFGHRAPDGSREAGALTLLLGGVLGGGATMLPGIGGGYILLIMGLFVPVLSAVDSLKAALLADGGPDWRVALDAFWVLLPVGVGIALGVAIIANAVEWALARRPRLTLGLLMGLLVGAVFGLWPFQRPIQPAPGDVVRGEAVTGETLATIPREYWRLEGFTPVWWQALAALGLIVVGYVITVLVGRLGAPRQVEESP